LGRIATRYGVSEVLDVPGLAALELPLRRLALPPAGTLLPGARLRQVEPDELAFVQFSSGSTSFPKGVPVTQGNLVANIRLIAGHDGRTPEDQGFSWLPLYHDMGLISLLSCFLVGHDMFMTAPMAFVMDPLGWLEALSERRASISVIPNFAIDYSLKRLDEAEPEDVERVELSALRMVYLGSEPINIPNLERFTRMLAPRGLKREVFKPCYGMAEAVLMVSCTGMDRGWRVVTAPNGVPAISVGPLLPAFELRLRSEEGRLCGERELGEIELRGGSLAPSYFEDDRPLRGEEGFYSTGDLGFLQEGELFITGRISDRIKVNGQSFFSSDFEQAIERLPFIRPGRTVAIQSGGRVVVLAEVNHPSALVDGARARKQVVEAVLSAVGVTVAPEDVLFVRYGQFKKTSSGKLQRRAMTEAYEQGRIRLATPWGLRVDVLRMHAERLVLGTLVEVRKRGRQWLDRYRARLPG
ncbi:MAG TPA: AMP-binding protein, partial [Myxococcaceae bacterium]|nr:AMP-binding protein [Myxococcaceae bacterium]